MDEKDQDLKTIDIPKAESGKKKSKPLKILLLLFIMCILAVITDYLFILLLRRGR